MNSPSVASGEPRRLLSSTPFQGSSGECRIASASFYTTLNRALQICVSLFTLMAGVFVRPELVVEPGLSQIGAALLIFVATIGITFSLQAQFADRAATDVPV